MKPFILLLILFIGAAFGIVVLDTSRGKSLSRNMPIDLQQGYSQVR